MHSIHVSPALRRLGPAILSLVSFLPLTAGPGHAKGYGVPLGGAYLSFDPESRVLDRQAGPMGEFDFYLILELDFADLGHPEWNATQGMAAFELGVLVPSVVVIEGLELIAAGSRLDWVNVSGEVLSLAVTFEPGCLLAAETPQPVLHLRARLLTEEQDVRLGITAADPSSFTAQTGGPGPAPGWLQCAAPEGQLYPFAEYTGPRSLVLHRTGVASQDQSWGALKAAFRD